MIKKRTIEIFSSGCPLCIDVIRRIYQIAGNTCTVSVLDVHDPLVVDWADRLHIHSPSSCCGWHVA